MRLILTLVFLAFATQVYGQAAYHCRRREDCGNGGTCDPLTGECGCAANFEGYNCMLDSNTKDCDSAVCQNGGTCYSGTSCFCPYGFYGATCENENFEIICNGQNMEIKIHMPESFAGDVTLENGVEDTDNVCGFAQTGPVDGLVTYGLTVNYGTTSSAADGCGSDQMVVNEDEVTLQKNQSTNVLVEYKAGMTTSIDEFWNFTCMMVGQEATVYKVMSPVKLDPETNVQQAEKTLPYSPLEAVVKDANMQPLGPTTELSVGEIINLHIYLTDNEVFDNILIEALTTNDTTTPNLVPVELYKDACSTSTGNFVIVDDQKSEAENNMPGVVLKMRAFKFHASDIVGFVASVRMCKPNADGTPSTECDIAAAKAQCSTGSAPAAPAAAVPDPAAAPDPNAPAQDPTAQDPAADPAAQDPAAAQGGARRRRSAEGDKGTVSTQIIVKDPYGTSDQMRTGQGEDNVADCLARSEVLAILVVMGLMIAILFTACFVVICMMMRRKTKDNLKALPYKRDHFHIPRAHVNASFRDM